MRRGRGHLLEQSVLLQSSPAARCRRGLHHQLRLHVRRLWSGWERVLRFDRNGRERSSVSFGLRLRLACLWRYQPVVLFVQRLRQLGQLMSFGL